VGNVAVARQCRIDGIDVVVTSSSVPTAQLEALKNADVHVEVVA
jgi:DeoR/GlpR family transcriptional regulator of sugar metabolism